MLIHTRFKLVSYVPVAGKMRSKSSRVESPANGVLGVPQGDHDISQEQEVGLPVKSLKAKVQQNEGEDKVVVEVISDKDKLLLDTTEAGDKSSVIMDLPKEDLLKLLGIMEGEIQVGCMKLPLFVYVTFDLL